VSLSTISSLPNGLKEMPKLNYRIVGRRALEGDTMGFECVDVEWTHTSGSIQDTHRIPKTHPPDIQYEIVPSGYRDVIKDCVYVKPGTKDSVIMQMMEEKKEIMARSLGLEL
jgi:hypothetical protein